MKISYRIVALTLCTALLAGLSVPASAAQKDMPTENRTVKVAFPSQSGMSQVGSSGDLLGYNYDYLQNLAEYAGWDIEYITYEDVSANEGIMAAMQDVMSGEADLLGPILKSAAIEEMFEVPQDHYGVVYTTLCASEKSDLSSVNYTQRVPLRVAVYSSATTRNQEVTDYLDQLGIEYELLACDTTEEQAAAVENGTADVLSSITLSYFEGTRAVARFAPRPYYFVSTKGNTELVKELDAAVEQMNKTKPKLQDEIQEKYFGDTSGGYVLTTEEEQFMGNLQSLDVLCTTNYAPYSSKSKTNEPTGVLVSLLNSFAAESNVKINYTFADTLEDLETKWNTDEYDCVIGLPFSSSYCVSNGLVRSDAIITANLEIYGKPGSKAYKDSSVAVYGAFLDNNVLLNEFAEIKQYPSIQECFRAVDRGEADYGCADQLSSDYEIFDRTYSFVTYPLTGEQVSASVAVSRTMDGSFLSALNKYIKTLPDNTITNFVSEATRHEDIDALHLFVRTQPLVFALVIIVAAGVLIALLTLLYNSAKNKKWNLQLQEANDAMHQATQAKSEFLARMSHEIRTPLNAVIGYMGIAQAEKIESEKVQHCLTNSELAAKHLLSIINDVLDVSAIESGKIKIASKDYNLKQQISTAATIFYNQARSKDVNFKVQIEDLTEEWVVGDQLRVNQIIMNLISNAVKFTPVNGEVTLRVRQLEKSDEQVVMQFAVSDTGIGMSKEYLSRIFTPFEQESAGTAQKYGGTGLGLSICKNLTTMMRGTIQVESEQNVGTTFTVTLPFGISGENAKVKHEGVDFTKLRALVVDDMEDELAFVKQTLKRIGVKADTFTSGEAAVKRFAGRQNTDYAYDICIIDWKMPRETGFEVAKKIREIGGDNIPVIVATAYDASEIDDEAKAAGVNSIVTKPLFQSTLMDMLSDCFGGYQPKGDANIASNFDLAGANILLAEDNKMNTEIAVSILTKAGIHVTTAENGRVAVDTFTRAKPGTFDAILMDVQMPEMDGYEATEAIRGSGYAQAETIPIIAMTANAFTEDIETSLKHGMSGHISKPVDYEKLYRTLSECMAHTAGLQPGNNLI